MPVLQVEGFGSHEVPAGKRLVLALEDDVGADPMYLCGGKGICATCVVDFEEGEPAKMTAAERERLDEKSLSGVRLACQIGVDADMKVRLLRQVGDGEDRNAPGPRPADGIAPDPVWLEQV